MHHFYPVRTALVLMAFGFSVHAQTESLSLSLNECVDKALDYQF
ncbi:MAG: hypothetical protein RL157_530, partial [Bacteroidota bacterium]